MRFYSSQSRKGCAKIKSTAAIALGRGLEPLHRHERQRCSIYSYLRKHPLPCAKQSKGALCRNKEHRAFHTSCEYYFPALTKTSEISVISYLYLIVVHIIDFYVPLARIFNRNYFDKTTPKKTLILSFNHSLIKTTNNI